jgi:hypothetical protein
MKRITELNFLKSIISSGLLSSKTSNSNELYVLNSTIKQMFRMLKFSLNNDSNLLYFWVSNKYLLNLFSVLIQKEYQLPTQKFFFETNLPQLNLEKKCASVFMLGDIDQKDRQFLKKLKLNNILLITKINALNKKSSFGTYKINSELNNLKSVCFYIIIINHILKMGK